MCALTVLKTVSLSILFSPILGLTLEGKIFLW